MDNFYDTGDVSGNGWPWSTAARESDAGAKMPPPNYAGNGGGGSYDWEGTNRNVNVALTGAARVAADPLAATLDPDTLPGQGNVAVLAQAPRNTGGFRCGDPIHSGRFHGHQGSTLGVRGKRGPKAQAIGPSRGCQTTKVHALADVVGRPFKLILTPGNVSDVTVAPDLLADVEAARYVLAEKGYDADALRKAVRRAGAAPVIPGRITRKKKVALDKKRYRDRHPIENAFCRLKGFRRIATRSDKLAANFLSAVALTATLAFWLRSRLNPSTWRETVLVTD